MRGSWARTGELTAKEFVSKTLWRARELKNGAWGEPTTPPYSLFSNRRTTM